MSILGLTLLLITTAASLGGTTGRITGIAVDPIDPAANTIYISSASGGTW